MNNSDELDTVTLQTTWLSTLLNSLLDAAEVKNHVEKVCSADMDSCGHIDPDAAIAVICSTDRKT